MVLVKILVIYFIFFYIFSTIDLHMDKTTIAPFLEYVFIYACLDTYSILIIQLFKITITQ